MGGLLLERDELLRVQISSHQRVTNIPIEQYLFLSQQLAIANNFMA